SKGKGGVFQTSLLSPGSRVRGLIAADVKDHKEFSLHSGRRQHERVFSMLEAAIDVHHHVLPPMWLAEAREHKAGGWAKHVLEWTPERSLEQMDRYGIGTAIV